jgi:hypothetical protein
MKSSLENALLSASQLNEMMEKNTKGIVEQTVKKTIEKILTEENTTMNNIESEKSEEDEVSKIDTEKNDDSDEKNIEDDDSTEIEKSSDDIEDKDEFNDEPEDDSSDEENPVDMTGASKEDVVSVFKKLKDSDKIIVKKDNKIEFSDGENEYVITFSDEEDGDEDEDDFGFEDDENDEKMVDEFMDTPTETEKGTEFVIDPKMGEKEEEKQSTDLQETEDEMKESEKSEEPKEEEVEESARTIANGYNGGLESKTIYDADGNGKLQEQVETLTEQNKSYIEAINSLKEINEKNETQLTDLKKKLHEFAILNVNLAYATKLFTECTTTKAEKKEILKKFESVKTINESEDIYNKIFNEFNNKQVVENTVTKKLSSSSSNMLNETTVYNNTEFSRIKDLMNKVK